MNSELSKTGDSLLSSPGEAGNREKVKLSPVLLCEFCGPVSHTLMGGECPVCGIHQVRVFGAAYSRVKGRVKSARPLNAELIIMADSANNPMITLLPANGVSHG